MTYGELLRKLEGLSLSQLQAKVKIEDSYEQEIYDAELKICGEKHFQLEDGDPVIVIYFDTVMILPL